MIINSIVLTGIRAKSKKILLSEEHFTGRMDSYIILFTSALTSWVSPCCVCSHTFSNTSYFLLASSSVSFGVHDLTILTLLLIDLISPAVTWSCFPTQLLCHFSSALYFSFSFFVPPFASRPWAATTPC